MLCTSPRTARAGDRWRPDGSGRDVRPQTVQLKFSFDGALWSNARQDRHGARTPATWRTSSARRHAPASRAAQPRCRATYVARRRPLLGQRLLADYIARFPEDYLAPRRGASHNDGSSSCRPLAELPRSRERSAGARYRTTRPAPACPHCPTAGNLAPSASVQPQGNTRTEGATTGAAAGRFERESGGARG